MYSDYRDIQAARNNRLLLLEDKIIVRPAEIVSEGGETTYLALGTNWTWVSYSGQKEANKAPVWNPTTLREEGTAVLVARQPTFPYRWEIIGVNSSYEVDTSVVPISQFNTGLHASSHRTADESDPGPDPVDVFQPMMYVFKTVGDGATLTVSTYPYDYNHGGSSKFFPGADTDLTSSVPAAGLIRNVLIYLDRLTNILYTVEGPTVIDNGIIPVPLPLPPHDEVTKSAWVTLANGQTDVTTADDIDDGRDFLGDGSDSAVPAPTGPGQVFMSDDVSIPFWATPVIAHPDDGGGWLTNEDGDLIVVG